MGAEFSFRPFRRPDLERLVEFRARSAGVSFPGRSHDPGFFREQLLRRVKRDPGCIIIAERSGSIAGYVQFRESRTALGRAGVISHVFVDEAFRRHGLGRSLMEAAEQALDSRGVDRVRVTVTSSNAPSLGLCRGLGYRETRLVLEKDISRKGRHI
jgi:ribosomal protein S18 acetylase RimI-like enzyme